MGTEPDRITVLHVDDDPGFADVVSAFLEREVDGIETVTAADAAEAFDLLAEVDPDCVVSDYDMPGTDGIAFLAELRERGDDRPFILFTGKGSEEVASDAISAGVTDYLQKGSPDRMRLLANRIVDAVEKARAERRAERSFEALETATEGISVIDADGAFVYVNEAYADAFGYEPDELVGEHWSLLYPDANVDRIREEVLPAVPEEGRWTGETVHRRKDGTRIAVDHALARSDDALVCTVRGVVADPVDGDGGGHGSGDAAGDRATGERYEEQLEGLHAVTRALVAADDPETVAETVVAAARDLLDMPINACWLYDEADDVLRPAAATDEAEAVVGDPPTYEGAGSLSWEAFRTGEPAVFDDLSTVQGRFDPDTPIRSEIVLPVGEYGVMNVGATEPGAFDEADVSLARILAGNAEAALARLDRETRLREEEEFVSAALDALDDTFYVFDAERQPVRWNDSLPARSGYTDAEIAEMGLLDFFEGEDRERVAGSIDELFETGQARIDADLVTKAGDRVPMEFTGSRLTDSNGEVIGFAGVGRDVSERRVYERRLERQNERLEEFASVVSHDLRNPLSVAQGRLDLAEEECPTEHHAAVRRAHERMNELIDDLLVRAREGATALEVASVDLGDVAEAAWRSADTGAATLTVESDRPLRADETRLRQLLENLFRNSVEHGSTGSRTESGDSVEHGSTSSRAEPDDSVEHGSTGSRTESGDSVEHGGRDVTVTVGDSPDGFYVADDGSGVPPDERDAVFEAGYSTSERGTGFGLSIVADIAATHGWEVTLAESDAGGARFEFRGAGLEPGDTEA